MNFPNLFSPIKIGAMGLKNRFVVPPMDTGYTGTDGHVTQRLVDYHVARAKGGFGLIVVEYAAVDPLGRARATEAAVWSDEFVPGWKALVDAVHQHGAKIALQLHHAGRETRRSAILGKQPVAPSPIPVPFARKCPVN